MTQPIDPTFFERADAHIALANAQLSQSPGPRVAASMCFANARFNAWLCANMYADATEMKQRRDNAIAQLSEHYRQMLEESFDDHILNFDNYRQSATR